MAIIIRLASVSGIWFQYGPRFKTTCFLSVGCEVGNGGEGAGCSLAGGDGSGSVVASTGLGSVCHSSTLGMGTIVGFPRKCWHLWQPGFCFLDWCTKSGFISSNSMATIWTFNLSQNLTNFCMSLVRVGFVVFADVASVPARVASCFYVENIVVVRHWHACAVYHVVHSWPFPPHLTNLTLSILSKFIPGFSFIFSNQFLSNLFSCLVNKSLLTLMLSGDGHSLTRIGSSFTFHSSQNLSVRNLILSHGVGITLTGDAIEWR